MSPSAHRRRVRRTTKNVASGRLLCREAPAPLDEASPAVGFAEGASPASDADLIRLVAGDPELPAEKLLTLLGGLPVVADAGVGALVDAADLAPEQARRLVAALELGRRVLERARRPRSVVASPADVVRLMEMRLAPLDHEQMWLLALDGRSGVRGMRCVSRGGRHGCAVTARDLLRVALLDGASAMVLVHNHPSGDPEPSPEDIEMTEFVARAGEAAGVPLVDHVVVAPSGAYASLLERGHRPAARRPVTLPESPRRRGPEAPEARSRPPRRASPRGCRR